MTEETILDVIRDDFPQFLAESFAGWRAILAAAFGLPVEDMPLIERLTARTRLPMKQVAELYLVCGRRAGKSLIAALIAVYFTAYRVYPSLVSGETAQFVVVSASKQQAKTIKRYYLGLMRSRPELAAMVILAAAIADTKARRRRAILPDVKAEGERIASEAAQAFAMLARLADESKALKAVIDGDFMLDVTASGYGVYAPEFAQLGSVPGVAGFLASKTFKELTLDKFERVAK